MSDTRARLGRDEVLDAFSIESEHGKATLDRYLYEFPRYAADLIDLSRELARPSVVDKTPLSEADNAKLQAAWEYHIAAQPHTVIDPFASMSPTRSREIAAILGVPRQVISAFRERRVLLSSVPQRFLRCFAETVNTQIEELVTCLMMPPAATTGRSYKAAAKPCRNEPATFERVLIDAGVPEAERASLLADD